MGKAKRKSNRIVAQSVTPLLAPIQALQSLLSQFKDQGVIIVGWQPASWERRAIRLTWMQ
jgi:hypothetical protein